MIHALLERLGRLIGVDVRYVAVGGFWLSLSQVANAVMSFLLTVCFANLLDPSAFGTYRYVLSAYTLLSLFALSGADIAVTRAVSRGDEEALRRGATLRLRYAIFGTLAAFGVGIFYYLEGSPVVALLFFTAGLMLPLMESGELVLAYFNGKRMFREWSYTEIGAQAVSLAALAGTMFLTKNLALILLAYFIPYILVRGGVFLYTVWQKRLRAEPTEDIHPYARSMTLFQILMLAGNSLDQIVLFHYLGATNVALFALAQTVPVRLQSLFKITGSLAFPKYAEREANDILPGMPRKMLLFALVILAACAFYILLAPLLFSIFFPKYVESIPYSQVLVFFTLSAVTYPFSAYLTAHKKISANYLYGAATLGLKMATLLLFVPRWGVWGAVLSMLVSTIGILIITAILFVRERRMAAR